MKSNLAKEKLALYAKEYLASLIKNSQKIGIGTGSTVRLVLSKILKDEQISSLVKTKQLYVSSYDTLIFLRKHGIDAYLYVPSEGLDLYFDGADEVSFEAGTCMVLKGRGAAMTLEKTLAYNSMYNIILVDESKISNQLGEKDKPVPLDVIPPVLESVVETLRARGIKAEIRSECKCRDGPACSDIGGYVIDTWPWRVINPIEYESLLDTIPGVIGHGLFIGYIDKVLVGYTEKEVEEKICKRTRIALHLREKIKQYQRS